MPATILLTLKPDVDANHFAWRHLRSHVLPALNKRFAAVGVEVQLSQSAAGGDAGETGDDGYDHLVAIKPYSADDLSKPGSDIVEELSQLIAAEYLGSTIESPGESTAADEAAGDEAESDEAAAAELKTGESATGVGEIADSGSPAEATKAEAAPTAAPVAPLKLPHRIDKFTLTRALGRGGMGEVYAAVQENLGRRPVAMKLVRGVSGSRVHSRIRRSRFQLEAAILARMQHPNIVTLYDAGHTDDGTMWMAMELIYGQTLLRYCDNHRLPIEQRLELFAELCDAAAAIGGKGVIHRNLSPHNILVTTLGERPVVKVVDFGIARPADPRDPLKGPREREGQIYGSLAYMAPEQAIGSAQIDTRADIYVLGVVLFELLTGTKALAVDAKEALDVDRIVQRILTRPIPPPSSVFASGDEQTSVAAELRRSSPRALVKQLRAGLDDIVLGCVAKHPSERYPAAHQIAKDIRAWRPKRRLLG